MAPSTRKHEITVSVAKGDPSSDPIVVSFPGGVPIHDRTTEPPQFVHRRIREGAKFGRRIIGRDATCVYQAENSGRGSDGRRTKLCIGIYNKDTGTLKVVMAAEKGTVFSLQQSIPNYTSSLSMGKTKTAAERRKALYQDFGSSKKQKVLASQEANLVTVDSVLGGGSLMAGAFRSQTKMSASNRKALEDNQRGEKLDAVESAYAEARQGLLPTFDMGAKEPHLVYSARDIAGDDAWGRISRLADAVAAQAPTFTTTASTTKQLLPQWHPCVFQILQSIPIDSPNAKYQIKICILLNSLISFHLQNYLRGDVRGIARTCKLSVEVCQRFLHLFATPMSSLGGSNSSGGRDARYATSKSNKDKCRVHILILFIMAQGGRSMKVGSITPIVEILKMDMSEASSLLREAGFTMKGSSAALTVPLKFPPPKRGVKAK